MNEITTTSRTDLAAMSADDVFNPSNVDDLMEGVSGGFGVISFRGGKWRIKHGGEETLIKRDDEPVASIPVVIVKSNSKVSKIFYEKNYEEGDDASPDCYSLDGEAPDAGAPSPQAKSCATCPQNQWGSRVTDAGKKAKRCSDNRRVAVVPAQRDVKSLVQQKGQEGALTEMLETMSNEMYGGPMLLRVPPASLSDMATFARELKKRYPEESYNSIVTVIGFDPDTAYPKLTFKALRKLTEQEKLAVVEFWRDGSADNVLATPVEAVEVKTAEAKPEPKKTVDTELEDDSDMDALVASVGETKPEPKPKKARKKAVTKKAAAKKGNGEAAAVSSGNPEMDEGLDEIHRELGSSVTDSDTDDEALDIENSLAALNL